MLKWTRMHESSRAGRVLCGAVVAIALAAPAGAGTVYSWRTEDGGYAFADDLRRVPARYRDEVTVREMGSLATYKRYSPQAGAVADAYEQDLTNYVAHLRALNAELEAPAGIQTAAGGATFRAGAAGDSVIEVTPQLDSDEPVVIEKRRIRDDSDGWNRHFGRHTTIVRQGDRVLTIVKPPTHGDAKYWEDLSDDD